MQNPKTQKGIAAKNTKRNLYKRNSFINQIRLK